MAYNLLKATILATFLASATALQNQVIVPFSDSACSKPAPASFDNPGDENTRPHISSTDIILGMGVGAAARGNQWVRYDKLDFAEASAPENGAGNWVWWNTGPIDTDCKVIFMVPFANDVSNYMNFAPDQAPGKVILAASQEGCVFTPLPKSATLFVTFCCNGGCDIHQGNAPDPQVAAKRSIEAPVLKKSIIIEKDTAARSVGSLAARAAAYASTEKRDTVCDPNDKPCNDEFWKTCKIDPGEPTLSAGLQVAVSQIQTATTGPGAGDSSIAASLQFTIGTSTSVTSGSSFSSEQGVSVSMSAGTTFPVKAETSVSATLSFTEEINKSTGHEDSSSRAVSITQTLSMVPGTTGFMSYVPYYNCYMPTITCGTEETTGPLITCYPALDSSGQIRGEYSIVTL